VAYSILVVDDDPLVNDVLVSTLNALPYEVDSSESAESALTRMQRRDYDLIISDVRMKGMDGLQLLDKVRLMSPETVVIMMTAYGQVPDAVRAMKAGAFEFLLKPVGADVTEAIVERALEFRRLKLENKMLRAAVTQRYAAEQLVGQSAVMRRVFDTIDKAATAASNVLISGETGTGKELVARAIHFRGNRREGPFEAINCAALPETLFESELFGHEKGAFTGAMRTRRGAFEVADGGTLLLDEISEMTRALQAKLLRVLQEMEVQRLGSEKRIPVDVRVIATTNRDLPAEIESGEFRRDLYYRLNVLPVHLPPLRDRRDDIPELVDHFIRQFNAASGRTIRRASETVMKLFDQYPWPGNIRELENFMERAVLVAARDVLTPEDFPGELLAGGPRPKDEGIRVGTTMRDARKNLVLATLEACGGNQTQAADMLGISSRTIRNLLYEYGIKTPGGEETGADALNPAAIDHNNA